MNDDSPTRPGHDAVASGGLVRIALIGPVLPFRGGIAQYTTQLHRTLTTKCKLLTISYQRQYPALLYPGKSDREPGMTSYREPGVEYILDALNPLSWRRAVHAVTGNRGDLAVFEWWTLFWAPAIALMAHSLRRRGVRVAFLCHNLFDHDSGMVKRKLARWLLAPADAYLVHSTEQKKTLESTFPGKTVVMHPIPPYDQFPPSSARLPKRGRLELLFFGFIRPYKGLDVLVEALAKLDDPQVYLTVVGEPWLPADELRKRIDAKRAPNVELHLDYVDDTHVAEFFGRADLVVLPYLSASGSAVAAMAFHYGCPILATRIGGFPDVVDEGKTGYLVAPSSPGQLMERLRSVTRSELMSMAPCIKAANERFTWRSLADALIGIARGGGCSSARPHVPHNGSPQ